nr:ATP-binding protein [Nocardioides sp. zg-1230]
MVAGPADVDRLLHATARRFSPVADRRWVVEADAGTVQGSAEHLRACLDTLIENALRYTGSEDTVRLIATRDGEHFWMGVADSGPGLAPDLAAAVNAGRTPAGPTDGRSQTGLGLSLVRDIVQARHGRLYAGRCRSAGGHVVGRGRDHGGGEAVVDVS